MKALFLAVFLSVFLYATALSGAAEEDEEFEYKTVIKVVDGIKFDVPEDRPIERKDGVIGPMPMDKYVAFKFSKSEKRLEKIEDSIERIEEDLKLIRKDIESLKKHRISSEKQEGVR